MHPKQMQNIRMNTSKIYVVNQCVFLSE